MVLCLCSLIIYITSNFTLLDAAEGKLLAHHRLCVAIKIRVTVLYIATSGADTVLIRRFLLRCVFFAARMCPSWHCLVSAAASIED